MLRREVMKMGGGLFGLGAGTPSRFPYPGRPQPSPAVGPSSATVVRTNRVIVTGPNGGIFVYSGPPASGNLIESIGIVSNGFDPFHLNAVVAGDTRYHNNGAGVFVAQQSTQSLVANLLQATSALGPYTLTGTFISFTNEFTSQSIIEVTSHRIQLNGPAVGGGNTSSFTVVPPSGDATGATDVANINAEFAAGNWVQLLRGQYLTNAPINIPPGMVLKGAGRGMVNGDVMTSIKAVAVMDAVVCSNGWDTPGGNTGTQAAVHIADLQLNGNTNKATHGLVLQNFSSLVRDVYVRFVVQDGFRLDGFNQAGTVSLGTTSTASGVNNQFVRCVAENCTRGFASNDPNGLFTDSLLSDGYVVNPSSFAVDIQNLGGWKVSGNHFYGLNQNGLRASIQSANTRIIGNYFEPWGATATPGQYLAINLTANDNGAATIIAGNNFWFNTAPGNATSTIIAVGFVSAIAGAVADVVIVGNGFQCAAPAASFNVAYPQQMFCTGVSTINVVSDGNLANGHWTANTHDVPGTGTINRSVGF